MLDEAMWSKIEPEPNTGCWLWAGAVTLQGYGEFNRRGRVGYVHRAMYVRANGPIKAGLQIDHACRVRSCCNPAHLRAVTPRENNTAAGSLSRTKVNALKTHCRNGHPYDQRDTRGQRECSTCKRANRCRYYHEVERI